MASRQSARWELSGVLGVVFSFLFPCSWLECLLLGAGRAAMRHPHLGVSDMGLKEALGTLTVTVSVASIPPPSAFLLKTVSYQPADCSAISLAGNFQLPGQTY